MKFSISMPDELVRKLDELAKENFCTRSGIVTIAAREYVANTEAKKMLPALEAAIRAAAAKNGELSEKDWKTIEAWSMLSDAVQGEKN